MKMIPLTRGMVALVDDEDYDRLSKHEWRAYWRGYTFVARSRRRVGGRTLYMHREILNAPTGREVDHVDGNSLNNCRSNIRLATTSQNNMNKGKPRIKRTPTSKYKGVYWDRSSGAFRAGIRVNGIQKHLGQFRNEEDAARAYDVAAHELFGEFARLNFPGVRAGGAE